MRPADGVISTALDSTASPFGAQSPLGSDWETRTLPRSPPVGRFRSPSAAQPVTRRQVVGAMLPPQITTTTSRPA